MSNASLQTFATREPNSFVDGPFGSDLKVSDYTDAGVRILQLQNLGDGFFIDKNLKYTSESKALALSRCAVRPGDLIIAKMAEPLARACIVPDLVDRGLIVADLIKLRLKPGHDATYVCAAINDHEFRREAERLSTGTTRTRISLSTLKRIKLQRRTPEDEKRIGDIARTIDRAMEKTEALIEKYQQIKAGLMHDLFTRGMWTQEELDRGDHQGTSAKPGQLRPTRQDAPQLYQETPIGWIPKAWEASKLESEFEITSGITLGPHRRPSKKPHPYLRVANVYAGRLELKDVAFLEGGRDIPRKTLAENDLLVVEGHANTNEIGRCARAVSEVSGYTFQNHLFRLRTRTMKPEFSEAWLNGNVVRAFWLRTCSTSSGLNTINRTMLGSVPIARPSLEEQGSICNFIEQVSIKISSNQNFLTKIQKQRSGLMHDLLTAKVPVTPGPDTVT